MEMKVLETMSQETQFEVEVPVRDTSSSERNFTMIFDNHSTRNEVGTKIILSQQYNYDGASCYALDEAEGMHGLET